MPVFGTLSLKKSSIVFVNSTSAVPITVGGRLDAQGYKLTIEYSGSGSTNLRLFPSILLSDGISVGSSAAINITSMGAVAQFSTSGPNPVIGTFVVDPGAF